MMVNTGILGYNINMKKIGVLVHGLTVEYALDVLDGIYSFFSKKDDVQIFIAQTKSPHTYAGAYEYQSWSSTHLLFSQAVDAIIIITGSYASGIPTDQLVEELTKLQNKPIISISTDLKLPNSYYTLTECNTAYSQVVEHLTKVHNCKKIAFFSANPTGSIEALQRFEAYKNALAENNIPYDEKLVYNGYFTRESAIAILECECPTKDSINFDAIICANDLTAVGTQEYLKQLGYKIPEDIKVIGYDNSTYADQANPKLSTMAQNITEQGYKGAELAYRVITEEVPPKTITIKVTPMYRQSCGCISLTNYENVYLNQAGIHIHPAPDMMSSERGPSLYINNLASVNSVYQLLDLTQTTTNLHLLGKILNKTLSMLGLPFCMICFYDKPLILNREDDFKLPEEASVCIGIDKDRGHNDYNPDINFNPKENPFPDKYFENNSGFFMIHPIFSGKHNYGYIVCKTTTTRFPMYSIIIKILINTIAQSYEFTRELIHRRKIALQNSQLIKNNTHLVIQSKTDELTKILNRRGFLDLGQKTLDLAKELNKKCLVLFGDLDNLKGINDSFGHEVGDEAIKAAALAMAQTLRSTDTIARIGGDEFVAIAVGMDLSYENKLRQKLLDLCSQLTLDNKFEFDLSISLGVIEYNPDDKISLQKLISAADKKLYVEKKIKHKKNK